MSDEETRAGANPANLPAVPAHQPVEGTEDLLNSLIGECRHYVRIIAAQFANPETDPKERTHLLSLMMDLVRTGSAVGDTVAKLRGGMASEVRQRIIVERSASIAGGRGVGQIPENE
ncbi:MAG TPA: hypothetical protein VLW75_03320 [Rhizomicrobium sp.]|nr:hypothetical protein [Rhizomicrobium sp.]